MCKKSPWVKGMGENRGRWDAGFRSPLLRFLILHAAVEQCLDPGEHRGQIRGAARSRAACGQGPKPLAGAIGQMA